MQFKVMNYNVLHGFHSSTPPFTHDRTRQDLAVKVVKEQDPDLLVLTEACYGQRFKGILVDYQKLFGLPFYFYAQKNHENGVAVLSKFPFQESQNYSSGRVHFVRTQVDLEGKIVNLDVVHPHPDLSEEEKARFLKSVLRDHKQPYLLIGDFNACSPHDPYNQKTMVQSFTRFNQYAHETVTDLVTFRSIRAVESCGLVDTYKKMHPHETQMNYTVPTDLLSTDKGSGMRCDFIFCSTDFNIRGAHIIKNPQTEQASDHYPVVAILEI